MKKIYVVDGGFGMSPGNWIEGKYVSNMEDANLVMFTGGADINPMFYGEQRHPFTHCNPSRDEHEFEEFKVAKHMGLPMIGICRGAQLLCAMAGGKLVQHQENNGSHAVKTHGYSFATSSCHHQAQFPWHLPHNDWTLLGWTEGLSKYHEDADRKEMVTNLGPAFGVEVEDAYYRKLKALAVQCHPEWLSHSSQAITHYRKLVDKLMAGDL